ncbi:hypothetical protein BKH46_08025 [Helicobacter sp. 12S02634-8]|uniref:hypothetical protein n=1 Tax=Helicobacter sp. 12S02634-8 TaxID=1476199 RepID=UPI000BA66AA6|nr:hypothetical protein [Helicobacter sp. 12S02634-8]PAF46324.1 hypothetical protein BKH46_08025 [Helicobacter sp. 12S02634-8]
MLKKIPIILFICGSCLFADTNSPGRGWLQYEDEPSSSQKPIDTKKVSEKDILLAILKEQQKQTSIQLEILKILKVTNDLPEMIEVNGKKCLSNSSVDCFKMPITKDAARIPVMKQWLENPTVENALAYYKWQSKYLNQIFDVGYSLEFASKSTAPLMGIIPTYTNTNTREAEDQREVYIWDSVIKKLSKNMEINILIGKTTGFDVDRATRIFDIYDKYKSVGVKIKFVFENQESLNTFANFNKTAPSEIYGQRWSQIPASDKVISPNSFKIKGISVYATPMYLLKYNDMAKNIHFNQILGVGKDDLEVIFKATYRALILFKAIKPTDISGVKADGVNLKYMIDELNQRTWINDPDGKERGKIFRELLEKEINREK